MNETAPLQKQDLRDTDYNLKKMVELLKDIKELLEKIANQKD